ncbi:hypothetical protein ACHAWO_008597 [Cyclotella atomus]|uniref:Glycerophosphocholine acyltransferase 1 n=1 Tax=Cyclotella atomus TaxID=382360 RepID=A0ABD3PFW7_9STRA
MCQAISPGTLSKVESGPSRKQSWIKPIPLAALLPLLPFLPSSFYLNRGYTVWFHLCSLAYIPTRSAFLRKFVVLQGVAICAGWYAAIVNEYISDGNFCHALYRNMPQSLVDQIVVQHEDRYEMRNTNTAWVYKFLCHVVDILGHPVIVYIFWRIHKSYGETWKDLLSWPVIIMAWHFSRLWSLVHSVYNKGTWDFWYFGHDVYVLNDTSVYLTAYIAEGLCFGAAVTWKLLFEGLVISEDPVVLSDLVQMESKAAKEDPKPMLVHSESACSTSSIMG